MTRGFVTIATGKDKYFITAVNLLKSYRHFSKNPLPFAILADKENEYTALFDKVIVLPKDRVHCSFLDKIELAGAVPFDQTVFIESDCLAYGDLNEYFTAFDNSDDFSVFGENGTLDEKGWFDYRNAKDLKDKLTYLPQFHSGIIYLKNTEKCRKFYDTSIEILNNIDKYFETDSDVATDDKTFALSLSVCNFKTIKGKPEYICVYPSRYVHRAKPKMHIPSLSYTASDKRRVKNVLLCHFGMEETTRPLYKREIYSLNCAIDKKRVFRIRLFLYDIANVFSGLFIHLKHLFNKIRDSLIVDKIRKIFSKKDK